MGGHCRLLLGLSVLAFAIGCEHNLNDRIMIRGPWVMHARGSGKLYYCSDWSNIPITVKPEAYPQRLTFRVWAANEGLVATMKHCSFRAVCDDQELMRGRVQGTEIEDVSEELGGAYGAVGGDLFHVIVPPNKTKVELKHIDGNCCGEFAVSDVSIAPASEPEPTLAQVMEKDPANAIKARMRPQSASAPSAPAPQPSAPAAPAPPPAQQVAATAPAPVAQPAPQPPTPTVAPAASGQRWAVVIGVSQYADSRIPSLRYAAADANSFYDWLISPQGGQYPLDHVARLIDKDATAASIKKTLFDWLTQAIEEDVVTIYFAGHGSPASPDKPENLFFLSYDCDFNAIASSAFPMWDMETALKRFIRARKVIVIADACHSGGVGSAFTVGTRAIAIAPQVTSRLGTLTSVSDGVAVLCASDDKQLSAESQDWGGGHGVFTYFLLEGLKGKADYSADGHVTLGELIPYVSEQVRRATRNAQSPTVAGRFDPALSIGR